MYCEGIHLRTASICQAIILEVKSVVEIHFNERLGLQTFPQLYEWSAQPISVFGFKFVRWKAKEVGMLTLNTDGVLRAI